MFTQSQKREINLGITPQSQLGPGSYRVNKSTLKHSNYKGPAPFLSLQQKRSVFEEEARKRSYLPSVGQYDTTGTPLYIRGQNPNTSQFASRTSRFSYQSQNIPGPGEYEAQSQFDRQSWALPQVRPARQPHAQLTEPSIPYQNAPKPQNELTTDQRSRWVLETAGFEAVNNPSCQDYDPHARPELPRGVQVEIPVGGGGSSLARSLKPSPWARAPNRFEADQRPDETRAAVGLYQLAPDRRGQAGGQRQSNCFANRTRRFTYLDAAGSPAVGPGSYQLGRQGTIEGNNLRVRQQTDLRQEMQRRLSEADEIVRQIHPAAGQAARAAADERFAPTAQQRALMENPAVGQYDIAANDQIKPPNTDQLSVDARMRIALLSTFTVEKWHQQGASIPNKVLRDENPPERAPPEKPAKRGMLELQSDRDIQKTLCPQLADEDITAAVGQYDVGKSFKRMSDPKKYNSLPSSSFQPGNDKRYMDRITEQSREHEQAAKGAEQYQKELDSEVRQVGGKSTELNYNRAKAAQFASNVYFGSTVEREVYGDRGLLGNKDLEVPGPGVYNPQASSAKGQTINYKERVFVLQPNLDVLPEVLTQDIGPSAERALNVIADKKQGQTVVGPGLYGGDIARRVEGLKKSFNIKAQDKGL